MRPRNAPLARHLPKISAAITTPTARIMTYPTCPHSADTFRGRKSRITWPGFLGHQRRPRPSSRLQPWAWKATWAETPTTSRGTTTSISTWPSSSPSVVLRRKPQARGSRRNSQPLQSRQPYVCECGHDQRKLWAGDELRTRTNHHLPRSRELLTHASMQLAAALAASCRVPMRSGINQQTS